MMNDDDNNKNNKKHNKVQSDKLKKMLGQLKSPKTPPFRKPNSENIFDMIRSQHKPHRKKYSAEIIQLHPNGDLDFTQSDLYHDVQDEAYFEGYSDAEENLREQLDAVKTELEKVRSLLASVKHLVSVDC